MNKSLLQQKKILLQEAFCMKNRKGGSILRRKSSIMSIFSKKQN
jgi:hypothetical protein